MDAWPRETDVPSNDRENFQAGGTGEMRTVCVDRHKLTQNVLFADHSVRRVSLKQLWRLKWHKQYKKITGQAYERVSREPVLFGKVPPQAEEYLAFSARRAGTSARKSR